jgi:signal transduction protein with GAF and PtsI domain
MRHGLSIPIAYDPEMSPAVESLARAILGDSDDRLLPYTGAIAEAQLDITRVRQARHHIFETAHDAPDEAPTVLENKARIERFLQQQLQEGRVEGAPWHRAC